MTENTIKTEAERLLLKRRNDMKKIVFRLTAFLFPALFAGCQTARQNEKTWQQIGNVRPFFKNEKTLLPDRDGSNDNRSNENSRPKISPSKNNNSGTKPKD